MKGIILTVSGINSSGNDINYKIKWLECEKHDKLYFVQNKSTSDIKRKRLAVKTYRVLYVNTFQKALYIILVSDNVVFRTMK